MYPPPNDWMSAIEAIKMNARQNNGQIIDMRPALQLIQCAFIAMSIIHVSYLIHRMASTDPSNLNDFNQTDSLVTEATDH